MGAQVIDLAAAARRLRERDARMAEAVRGRLREDGLDAERTYTARELHARMLERVRALREHDPEPAARADP